MILPKLKQVLLQAGIKENDTICIFSDITAFGIPLEIKKQVRLKGLKFLMDSYIETFQDIVSDSGLIIMPTFTYSASDNKTYDYNKTESTVGALTEHFRIFPKVVRSLHPIFSFAGMGKDAESFLKIKNYDCFGKESIFGKLYDAKAKYLMFGVDIQHGATYVYFSEQKANVYYRYFKIFNGFIKNNNSQQSVKVPYFVRDFDIKYKDYWYDLEKKGLDSGSIKKMNFNGGNILVVDSYKIDKLVQKEVKKNKDFLIDLGDKLWP